MNANAAPRPATHARLGTGLLISLWGLVACGGGTDPGSPETPTRLSASARAAIEAKGGGGGGSPAPAPAPAPTPTGPAPAPGGGTKIPPNPTTDGPAWFFNDESSITTVGFTPDIDYTRLANMTAGGIPVGSTRWANELIYNVSKKTPLVVTDVHVTGANAADFVIDPQAIATLESTVLPPNKGAIEQLQIAFRPTAPGTRTANVVFTSAAGVVQIAVTGVGLPLQPVLAGLGPASFFPDSAPATFILQNIGGASLVLHGIAIGGASPGAFQLTAANSGFSNCFAGEPLAPLSFCYVGVGVVPGAAAPASAALVVTSNDPAHPTASAALDLVPLP